MLEEYGCNPMTARKMNGNPFLERDRPHAGDRVQIRSTGQRGVLETEYTVATDDGEIVVTDRGDLEFECWPDS